jgi:hypothetical protein
VYRALHINQEGNRNSRRTKILKKQCCGSRMFITYPGSELFLPGSSVKKIPDPGSASKNLNILNPKTVYKISEI